MNAVKGISKFSLLKELNAVPALTKSSRDKIAKTVFEDPTQFQSLIEIAFDYDNDISAKACSILETVCEKRIEYMAFNLNFFTDNLPNVTNEGCIRSMAKISNLVAMDYDSKFDSAIRLVITKDQISQLIESNFEWLLSDHKVGIKADAMEALYYLGNSISWIHYELKMILDKNIPNESPGYIARAKKILEGISKNQAA